MSILEIKNLKVDYETEENTVHALINVSLQITGGETLGLVGETGAGKTTLAKCIMGLLPQRTGRIRTGEILYGGEDLLKKDNKEMRRIRGAEIAMIFQDPMTSLNPVLTVGEQIAEAVVNHDHCSKAKAFSRAAEMLELVGIPAERLHEYPHQFSGGMKQRVVIAIALACNPKLLIADEPTTALDVTIQEQILDLLRDIQARLGTSAILVTHDLGVVARAADRAAVMYAGKIVEIGTVEDIFYDPRHPYTWGLLRALPAWAEEGQPLYTIPGMPPSLLHPPKGDAFACRNEYALAIDYQEAPPMFQLSDTHFAATWLLDERAPQITPPWRGASYE